jgi:hypothetical protein
MQTARTMCVRHMQRLEYKPHEIKWQDVAPEGETGADLAAAPSLPTVDQPAGLQYDVQVRIAPLLHGEPARQHFPCKPATERLADCAAPVDQTAGPGLETHPPATPYCCFALLLLRRQDLRVSCAGQGGAAHRVHAATVRRGALPLQWNVL